jgi:predicted DCC family thiol-disulfide oxidoreductase YuxK
VPDPRRRPVLLYDAECRFCRFAARTIERLDRNSELSLLPLEDGAASALLAALPHDERLATWRLVSREGSLAGQGRGIVELVNSMRLTRHAAPVATLVPPRALDALYSVVSRHRGSLGRLVPDGPAPRRYP